MKPIKLVMQAFGSYGGREEIDFEKIGQGIFLITGDTGAGKTTIFDGISFALYGKVSGNVREVTKLRSQYAPDECSTFVELLFSYRGKRYTIRRTPPYRREKKRNRGDGGTVLEHATASLTMPDGVCYTAVREVDGKIEEIMGVNADQFRQIVMIAQGEFQKLLLASSRERKEIFSKLFHTDVYRQIQEALRQRQKKLDGELQTSGASLRTLIEGIEAEGEAAGSIRAYLQETGDKGALPEEQGAGTIVRTLETLVEEDKRLEAESGREMERLDKAYRELLEELTQKQSRNREFDNLEEKQRQYGELREREEIYASRMRELLGEKEAEGIAPLKKGLLIRIDALERGLPAYEQYDALQKKYHKADKEYLRLKKALQKKKEKRAEKEECSRETRAKLDALEHIGEERLEAEKLLEDIKQAGLEWQENFKEAEKLLRREKDWKSLFADCGRAERERNRLTGERNQKQRAFLAGQAGLLAAEALTEGNPCPVCGSIGHPNPAKPAKDAVSKEEIDSLEKELQEAEERYRELYTRIESERKALEEAKGQLGSRFAKSCRQAVFGELQRLVSGEEIFSQAAAGGEGYLEKLAGRRAEALAVIEENRKRQAEITEGYKRKEKEKRNHRESLGLLEKEIQELDAGERADEAEMKQREMEAIRLREQMAGMKKDFVYASYEEAKAALATGKDCMRAVEQYEEERSRCHADVRALRKKLEGRAKTDLTGELQTKEAMEQQKKQNEEKLQKIRSRKDRNERQLRAIRTETEKQRRLFQQYEILAPLVKTACGNLTGKPGIDLEIYCQRRYMRRIVAAANRRLETMSRGGFRLLCKDLDEIEGRGNTGLELNVYAADTGMIRDVRSLSGGESFLASLAMALGLSDVISSMNGAVKFDTMFIDEGFGSLDEENRESAMQAFSELAGDSRMIGIISHVSELKERVDKKIVVKKLKNGSKIEMHLV